MSLTLSQRSQALEPSATLAVTARAKELKAEGKPVISFGAGEPDFNSPKVACDAAKKAMDDGHTHYTANPGIPELRKAVAEYYKKRFDIDYNFKQVLVGSGAKVLLYTALISVVNPGDEVIVITPAWVSYVEQIRLCGGKEVLVDTSDTDYMPSLERIQKAITPKTKLIMVNSPNNPTGAVYTKEILKGIADLAVKHGFYILNDEIYERLVYDGTVYHHILSVCPEAKDNVINVNGVSKAYAMTGWRIGYATGSQQIITAMSDMQSQLTSNACSIAQYASEAAIRYAEPEVESMRQAFEKRRKLLVQLLSEIKGLSIVIPKGAFYVMIDVTSLYGKKVGDVLLKDDVVICTELLENSYVAITPGSAFYAPGTMRLSYANSEEEIREGVKRIADFVASAK